MFQGGFLFSFLLFQCQHFIEFRFVNTEVNTLRLLLSLGDEGGEVVEGGGEYGWFCWKQARGPATVWRPGGPAAQQPSSQAARATARRPGSPQSTRMHISASALSVQFVTENCHWVAFVNLSGNHNRPTCLCIENDSEFTNLIIHDIFTLKVWFENNLHCSIMAVFILETRYPSGRASANIL